ncbi:hypothetical protein [Rugamonas apoptosis]|uniref:Uncharacterized protein n=1 Tax=Rugamonas apoptosis TaxID=2758570 RepID=A0A7W2ILD0_9BURK|nr:hypothetical protein [Rugamonas apoptosis]MBA5688680.1 hypothetical protein [Rugamonas apoptosis]
MDNAGLEVSFHELPLSVEQESELQHYIHQRLRRGLSADAAELRSMVRDMLTPPMADVAQDRSLAPGVQADAERAAGLVHDGGDPITTREERIAAGESEAMKHPRT